MQKEELNPYKQVLEAKLRDLSQGFHARDLLAAQRTPDAADEAQLMAEQHFAVLAGNQQTSMLHDIRAALERIADGSYGTCLSCEAGIPPQRLKALPWAALCVRCQERHDRGQTELPVEEPEMFEEVSSWRSAA